MRHWVIVITVMKFKSNFVSAFLLTCLCIAACMATATESKGELPKSESVVQERKLETQNQHVDLSKFEALRLRHSITLLPYARKSAHINDITSQNRRLDGQDITDSQSTSDQQQTDTIDSSVTWSDVQSQTPQLTESQVIDESQITSSVISNPDAFSATQHDEQFYESGSELFLAQEQKRILLLQFYEVIVNNPNRSPQVDPRIIKLMTNYLQTLEYIYVKQIQHKEESPPVLYDYRSDNETAAFCDSPPVSLPDQKFLNEDGDYFVKLFDAYNAGQLGVYMSPTQLKQQGLYRKLAGHIAQANADQRFRQSQFNARAREIARTMVQSRAKHTMFERRLRQKSKPDLSAKPEDVSKAEVGPDAINLKIDPKYVPHVIEAQDYDPLAFMPILPKSKKHKKKSSKKAVAVEAPKVKNSVATVKTQSKKAKSTRRLRARRSIRVPMEFNVGNDDPAPIFDDHPIQNANIYRENIHEDLMEILEFFAQQLDLIFRRLEILGDANHGLARWIIKPTWRDFEASVQYFHALASPSNRIIDAIDLIIRGCGNHAGTGFMSHLFLQENRFTVLQRRASAIENALSQARIHLIQMQNNLATLRHQAAQTRDRAAVNALNVQINQQIQATSRQQQSVNDLVRRMNVVTRYRNEGQRMGTSFNQMGNEIANQARAIRRNYVELEMLGRNMITATNTDLTNPRHQAICLRIFESSLPRMITLKRLVVSGIRRILPPMADILSYRPTITQYLTRYENNMTRRRKARKMKQKSKSDNKDVI